MALYIAWLGYDNTRPGHGNFLRAMNDSGFGIITFDNARNGLDQIVLERCVDTKFDLVVVSEFLKKGDVNFKPVPDLHDALQPAAYVIRQIREGKDFKLDHARKKNIAFLTYAHRDLANRLFPPEYNINIVPYVKNTSASGLAEEFRRIASR